MPTGERVQLFKVRRYVNYSDGSVFEFLCSTEDMHSKSGLLWADMFEDGRAFTRTEAEGWLAQARARNFNQNVVSHCLVPCQ
jgi:hypothetical protein